MIDSPFVYAFYDLSTGAYKGRLPLAGVTFGSQLLGAGSFSGTIDLASQAVQNMNPLGVTAPARTALIVDYLGAVVWAGIVWPRDYDFNGSGRKLTVTATELWSYIQGARVQATDYSAPPYSGISGTSKMPIWDATSTDGSGVYDPVLIAWQLISDALGVRYGNLLGGLSIAANSYTTAASYLASGTGTPSSNYLSVTYPYASIQQLGMIVNMLAVNGYGTGFDYGIDCAYSAGPGSPPIATVNLSYPRRGRSYAQNSLVLNAGTAISYKPSEDGTQTGNTVYEQGSSSALSVSQNLAALQGGYPLLEQIKSRSQIQSGNIMAVLAQIGITDLALASYPPATPAVVTDLFSGSLPLGEFTVGDDVRWIIPKTGGDGQVFDPRFPNGLDEEWRITAWSASVGDDSQSTLTTTLQLPPSTTIGGPMLP